MNKNIKQLYAFSFCWMFLVIIPVLIPYYQSLGLSMQKIFELQAIFGIAVMVFEVPTGYVADLLGRVKTLRLGALLSGFAFTYFVFAKSYPELIFFELILALSLSLVSGADTALLYDSLENQQHRAAGSRTLANMQLAAVSAEAIASLLGAYLAQFSFSFMLWGQCVAGWLPFVFTMGLIEVPYEKMNKTTHKENFKKVFSFMFNQDRLLKLISLNLFVWSLSTFIVVWMYQKYWQNQNISIAHFGWIWAFYNLSVGVVGRQVHWLEKKYGAVALLCFLSLSPIAGYFLMGFMGGWWGVFCGLLFYLSRGVTQVLLKDAFNWRLPSQFRATANSIQSMIFRFGFAIIGPLVGYSVDSWGAQRTLNVLGAFFSLMFVFAMIPLIKNLRHTAVRGAEA